MGRGKQAAELFLIYLEEIFHRSPSLWRTAHSSSNHNKAQATITWFNTHLIHTHLMQVPRYGNACEKIRAKRGESVKWLKAGMNPDSGFPVWPSQERKSAALTKAALYSCNWSPKRLFFTWLALYRFITFPKVFLSPSAFRSKVSNYQFFRKISRTCLCKE